MDISRLTKIKPSERQLQWQSLGFTAFLHFGINTFTNREWGNGGENPALYAPTALDTDQWCETLCKAGIKACILTAKHHDGFCLWDTAFTNHSVMATKYPIDVVASLADSCIRYGLKMGLYLSPWDRHESAYGSGKAYDDFYCGQLNELTTHYGALYTIWLDGACGEGADGRIQVYDWERYYAIIRKNQTEAVISVMGPDVRWIGNEAGITRKSEWSVVSTRLRDHSAIASRSQQMVGLPPISPEDEDIGSREALANEPELCWYPAEVDVSLRPGWFYHPEENDSLKSIDDLLNIYESSVGGNALLLLNIPPDTEGRINDADVGRLEELGEALKGIYAKNLCTDAKVYDDEMNPIPYVLVDDEKYWQGNRENATISVKFSTTRMIQRVILCEQIRKSQRIEGFEIWGIDRLGQSIIYSGTTVGFKKICILEPVEVEGIKIKITGSREWPTVRFLGVW